MRKVMLLLLLFALLMGCLEGTAQPTRADLRVVYTSQIGVKEATGHNDGPKVEAYLKSVGLPKENPWCAAFVNWCLEQLPVKTCRSGWVPAWFPENRLVYKLGKVIERFPTTGDLFGIYFAAKRRLAHIGFIDRWGEGHYTVCVEGNTNEDALPGTTADRDGGGVCRKYRLKSRSTR